MQAIYVLVCGPPGKRFPVRAGICSPNEEPLCASCDGSIWTGHRHIFEAEISTRRLSLPRVTGIGGAYDRLDVFIIYRHVRSDSNTMNRVTHRNSVERASDPA